MNADFDTTFAQFQKNFGKQIRRLRKERHWSQDVLAEKSGLTKAYISTVERGLSRPGIDSLLKFALSFNIKIEDLFHFPKQDHDIPSLKQGIKQLIDEMDNDITPELLFHNIINFFMQK